MDHTLQRVHNSTWTTHTAETTTLLDYKKLYTYMCNIQTLSWCQTSGKIQGGIYSDRTHTAFQEAFQQDFEYSDFFRDHPLQPQHIGDVRREFIHLWTQIRT